jgi:hypothetical protein
VGLQGAATAWLVAALTWIYTKRQVQSLPKAEDASGHLLQLLLTTRREGLDKSIRAL